MRQTFQPNSLDNYTLDDRVKRGVIHGQKYTDHPLILLGGLENAYINKQNKFIKNQWKYEAVPVTEDVLAAGPTFNTLTNTAGLYFTREVLTHNWEMKFMTTAGTYLGGTVYKGERNGNNVRFNIDDSGFVEYSLVDGTYNAASTFIIPSNVTAIYISYYYHPQASATTTVTNTSPIYQIGTSNIHSLFLKTNATDASIVVAVYQAPDYITPVTTGFNLISSTTYTLNAANNRAIVAALSLNALPYIYFTVTPTSAALATSSLMVFWHVENVYV